MKRRILRGAALAVLFAAGFTIGVNLGHEHADDCPRCQRGAGP